MGESQWEMDIRVIRVHVWDVYASYEGSYGVGDDVCATGGAPLLGGGGGQIFVVFGGGNPGVVGAGGEVRGGVRVRKYRPHR